MNASNSSSKPELQEDDGRRLLWAIFISLPLIVVLWYAVAMLARPAAVSQPQPARAARVEVEIKRPKKPEITPQKRPVTTQLARAPQLSRNSPPAPGKPRMILSPTPSSFSQSSRSGSSGTTGQGGGGGQGGSGNRPRIHFDPTTLPGYYPGTPPESSGPTGTPADPQQPGGPTSPAPQPDQPSPSPQTKDTLPVIFGNYRVKLDLPEDLKSSTFRHYLTAQVTIEIDGTITAEQETSTGEPRIDDLVMTAIRERKGKPATHDGQPIRAVTHVRFQIEAK